jgi:hypothetical protein
VRPAPLNRFVGRYVAGDGVTCDDHKIDVAALRMKSPLDSRPLQNLQADEGFA